MYEVTFPKPRSRTERMFHRVMYQNIRAFCQERNLQGQVIVRWITDLGERVAVVFSLRRIRP